MFRGTWVRLELDLIGFRKSVEVIDVVGSQMRLECIEDCGGRDVERLCFCTVDIDVHHWRVCIK